MANEQSSTVDLDAIEARADRAKWVTNLAKDAKDLIAEVKRLRALVEEHEKWIDDNCIDECSYHDGCPEFVGSRHGTCLHCNATRHLTRIRAEVGQ